MDVLQTAEAMNQAVEAATGPAVKVWMNWMMAVFLFSVVFLWKRKPARVVLATFVLSAVLGMLVFHWTAKPHLLGISHLVLWTPLAIYLFKGHYNNPEFKPKSFYGIWICLLFLTILVSLVFDVRDIFLVAMGEKF